VEEIERTMGMYHTAWLVCLIVGGVFFLAAVILFIVFRIPKVFMILTGIDRKRQIKEISENVGNENSSKLTEKKARATKKESKADNKKAGRKHAQKGLEQTVALQDNNSTVRAEHMNNAQMDNTYVNGVHMNNTQMSNVQMDTAQVNNTQVNNVQMYTAYSRGDSTEKLNRASEATTLLHTNRSDETAILTKQTDLDSETAKVSGVFRITQSIVFLGTEELLEI
jgi:hypothetical protein